MRERERESLELAKERKKKERERVKKKEERIPSKKEGGKTPSNRSNGRYRMSGDQRSLHTNVTRPEWPSVREKNEKNEVLGLSLPHLQVRLAFPLP